MNLWWCGEADQSVLSLSQSLAYYPDLIKRCSFYFLSYALNVEACDWDRRFSQAPKEGRHPGKKYKSVYMGIREERRAGGMTGFHVRKWTSSLRTPAGVGVEGRLTAWLASRNLPCFQRSEKNVIFITIKKCFCTNSVCEYYSAAQWKVSSKSEDMFSLMPWEASICISPVWSQNWVQRIRRFLWSVMGYRRPSHGAGGLFGELWKGEVKAVRITSKEGGKKPV